MANRKADLRYDDQVTDTYPDVLLNLEYAIHAVVYDDDAIGDAQIEMALEHRIRHYRAEAAGRGVRTVRMSPALQRITEAVSAVAEYQLGRRSGTDIASGTTFETVTNPIAHDELLACLKRIRKSVRFWNRLFGRRGYVTHVHHFLTEELDLP